MSKLGQLLSYLERPDVTELVFRSGSPAVMRVGHRLHPITVAPLRTTQIQRFFDGTPVLRLFPARGELAPQTHHLELQGRPYRIIIRGRGGAVELRLGKITDPAEPGPHAPPESSPTPDAAERRPTPVPRPAGDRGAARGSLRASEARERRATPVPRRTEAPSPDPSERRASPVPRRAEALPPDAGERTTTRSSIGRRPALSTERAPTRPRKERLGPGWSRDETPGVTSAGGAPAARAPENPAGSDLEIERNDDLGASYHGGEPGRDEASLAPDDDFVIERGGRDEPSAPRDRMRSPPPTISNPSAMPSLSHDEPAARRPPTAPNPVAMPSLSRDEPAARGPSTIPNAAAMPSLSRDEPAAAATEPAAPPPSSVRVPAPRHRPVHAGLRQLLTTARQQGASDVHIVSGDPIRIRRAGALEPSGAPIPGPEVEAMAESLLAPQHMGQLAALGYADLGAAIEGAGRLRVNVNRQRTGLKICVRLVVGEPPSVEALGLPPEVRKLAAHHQGMALVAGPNGHGKTTTMAALVDLFNAHAPLHIITVEDPVEVIHPRKAALVTQREIGTHTRSFPAALAAALREDPDVIAIGELRDRETVAMALAAAETGHLVLATMSTPSGAKTIDRMIDMFPPGDQPQVRATLAGALKLVISQRLVRRADGHGLVAAYEMITGNVPLWSLIRDDKLHQLPSLLQRGRNYGMIRLEDSLRALMSQGLVDEPEARLHAEDPRALDVPDPAPDPGFGFRAGR